MAVSDTYTDNPNTLKNIQCARALTLANNQYAVLPKFNDRIVHYISKVVDLIDQTPLHVKSALTGPIWATTDSYDSNESIYRDDSIRTLIDSKNRIVLGVRKL